MSFFLLLPPVVTQCCGESSHGPSLGSWRDFVGGQWPARLCAPQAPYTILRGPSVSRTSLAWAEEGGLRQNIQEYDLVSLLRFHSHLLGQRKSQELSARQSYVYVLEFRKYRLVYAYNRPPRVSGTLFFVFSCPRYYLSILPLVHHVINETFDGQYVIYAMLVTVVAGPRPPLVNTCCPPPSNSPTISDHRLQWVNPVHYKVASSSRQ